MFKFAELRIHDHMKECTRITVLSYRLKTIQNILNGEVKEYKHPIQLWLHCESGDGKNTTNKVTRYMYFNTEQKAQWKRIADSLGSTKSRPSASSDTTSPGSEGEILELDSNIVKMFFKEQEKGVIEMRPENESKKG
ncbi:hypothetical protein H4219_006050 [Mycoemilia scoparia]|uniref:Uncharacterized protein n=1 Tax=Mycoemilia scoparia TaxID=417184 RepID=A0A9W7ZLG2_9FUNG|nr:hypothetical protein H4219_006050 [Mycoemilia scoparia]